MDDKVSEAERLFDEGEELIDAGRDADALNRFQAAWDALPEPKGEQEHAGPILAALVDTQFFLGDWEGCRRAVQQAFHHGESPDNTFLRLRLGQSLYELGDEQGAADWLVPVYLAEGREPFEDEDPKYLEFFRGRLDPPPGGWPEGW